MSSLKDESIIVFLKLILLHLNEKSAFTILCVQTLDNNMADCQGGKAVTE